MLSIAALVFILAAPQGQPQARIATEGYLEARWGMTSEEVLKVFPSARKMEKNDACFGCGAEPDGLSLVDARPVVDWPAKTYFDFKVPTGKGADRGLSRVVVALVVSNAINQASPGDVAYQWMKERLERQYGPAKEKVNGLVRSEIWRRPETTIQLRMTLSGRVLIEYESKASFDDEQARGEKPDSDEQ
jgi:hypothetical protein